MKNKLEQYMSSNSNTVMNNTEMINKRRVINGQDDGLMQVSPLKHPWANTLFQTMLNNTWMPQEIPLSQDVDMWNQDNSLSKNERRAFKRSLAFVSNLDGLQTNNLMNNILPHITSPEIVLALVRQSFEEALHVQSYATIIEALGLDPEEIYGMYRNDSELYQKNNIVLNSINKIGSPNFKTGSFQNDQLFLEAVIGNIILEGIYFYSAFLIFYVLRRKNLMSASAEMIQFINRDETMHLYLFTHITRAIKEEQPELWTEELMSRISKNFISAVEMELEWGKSCIVDGIAGLNASSLEEYLHFIGDKRLMSIGLAPIWNAQNPFPWIDELTQSNMIEVNFFEGTVKEYTRGTLEW